jgi:hypothetical protein
MKTAVADVDIQMVTCRGRRRVIAQKIEKMAGVEVMWDEVNYS